MEDGKIRKIEWVEEILMISLIIFGIFIAYQLIRLIFSGSWSVESIILTLLVLIISMMFTIVFKIGNLDFRLATLSSNHKYLARDFNQLVKDFKEHTKHK